MTQVEKNQHVVRAFVDAINAQDWKALERVVAPGFVRHSYAAPGVRSRDELIQYLRSEYETFPDARETIEDMVSEVWTASTGGGGLIFRGSEGKKNQISGSDRNALKGIDLVRRGPYPPSGRSMAAEYIAVYRIEGEMIVESWAEWDNLNGLVQLGHYQAAAHPGTAAERPVAALPLSPAR